MMKSMNCRPRRARQRTLPVAIAVTCVSWSVAACNLRSFAGDPKASGDDGRVNTSTTQPVEGVPYCAGGARATACIFGANCRVTEQGCQVCQCLSGP